ncbi:hypothetical protein [Flagellimonas sp.]|uniref:hypothetical protein n=1 Tax=Flagellimonas sp. TaxID=2058762 RepID=UPI003AB10D11
MKKRSFLWLSGLLFSLNLCGQEFVLDDTKLFGGAHFAKYNSFDRGEYFTRYSNLRSAVQNPKSNGKDVRKNRTYERVDFTINGTALYSKNVKYRPDGEKSDFPKCKMYYASNDRLYYDYDPENTSILESPLYHENGMLWNVFIRDEEDSEVRRFIVRDSTGSTLIDRAFLPENENFITVTHPKYGRNFVHFIPAKKPSFYPSNTYFTVNWEPLMNPRSETRALYYGYDHVGSYINNVWGFTLTGFMLPTALKLGNGSVLFLEDEVAKKNYWAVVIDQEIKFKLEAKAEEKPDVVKLYHDTDIEVFSETLATVVSKNFETHNGYGINLVPQDNKKPGDGISLEVGIFKNGKLHGVGYRTKMIIGNDIYGDLTTIDATYGMFEDGQPVNVKHIKAFDEKLDQNFWDPMPVEGFSHVGKRNREDLFYRNYFQTKLSQLQPNDELYMESIHRTAKVKSINLSEQFITVYADDPDVDAKLDKSSGDVFVKETYMGDNLVSCPKTIKIPQYNEKMESYFVPGEFKSNSYVVKGVYYDKHVTNSTYKPAQIASKKVRYIEKHIDEVCPRCNGTGYVKQGTKSKNLWKIVVFE